MPRLHTELPRNEPGRYGEYKTAQWLSTLDAPEMHLWFGLNHLEAVGDIDQLVGDPRVGLWVIEVKGHNLGQIAGYSRDKVEYSREGLKPHPAKKAQMEAQRLSAWLKDRPSEGRKPWVHSAVWWPNIFREDWVSAFSADQQAVRDAESMLFTDEMDSEEQFVSILKRIAPVNFYGRPTPQSALEQSGSFLSIVDLVDSPSKLIAPVLPNVVKPIPGLRKEEDFSGRRIRLSGKPGTGKTVKLLEYGFHYLEQNKRVLYTCYGKALSSEIRRELSHKVSKTAGGEFLAMDVFQLSKYLVNGIAKRPAGPKPTVKGGDYAQLFRNSTDEIVTAGAVELFDAILIDEAQDFPEYGIELLQKLSGPDTRWVVADGSGQELFPPYKPPPNLVEEMSNGTERKLRRNFRQSPQAYLVYQAFDVFMDKGAHDPARIASHNQLRTWLDQSKGKEKEFIQLGFDFDVDSLGAEIRIDPVRELEHALHENLIKPMGKQAGSVDGMILLPSGKSDKYELTKTCLDKWGIPYLDLIPVENRRQDPKESALRISTVHSARGLTADFVCVLDFDSLCTWDSGGNPRGRQLATIALSRARKQTAVLSAGNSGMYTEALSALVETCQNFFAGNQG